MRTSQLCAGAQRAFLFLLVLASTRWTAASSSYCTLVQTEMQCNLTTRENEPRNTKLINFTREGELIRYFGGTSFSVTLDEPASQTTPEIVVVEDNILRSVAIDRESICDLEPHLGCYSKLSATAASVGTDDKKHISVAINLKVEDVNEPPKFDEPVASINVKESLALGSNVTYRAAITSDDSYRLYFNDPTGTFVDKGSHNNAIVISLAKRLDYETTRFYRLNLTACDTHQLCATLKLMVNVTDVNDNDPDFGPSANQTVTIADNTQRGSRIVQLTATDRDSDANGNVTYTFENVKASLPFHIDNLTGLVTTNGSLNIRLGGVRSSYTLTVLATDGGTPQRSATTTVHINVIDANDHDPVIKPSPIMSVAEDTAPVKAGFIIVSDGDMGDNSRTSCTTESTYRFNLTELKRWSASDYSSKLELILTERIDYDSVDNDFVNVTVICHDFGSPQRSSRFTVMVNIDPKNEYQPRFTYESYRFTVVENKYPLTVGIMQATDMDRNTVLTYSMRPANGATDNATLDTFFEISSTSGELRLRKSLDRETHSNFSFFVVASDGESGSRSHSASASVIIEVGNENDNAPSCYENLFRVPENREARYGVGRVGANDLDGDSLRFSLTRSKEYENDEDWSRIFEINETGFIFTKVQLDRENRSEYKLAVTVGDGHFVTQCPVQILVTDVNDNAPVWPPSDYQFNVSLTLSIGSTICELTAYDADNSSSLTYSIKSEYPSFIGLDQGGKMCLVRDLNENDKRAYVLTIEVSDGRHLILQDIRLLVVGDRTSDTATVAAKEQPTLMWNLLISIIIIVTTITISCLLIVAILFLRKRIRKQALIAREREQLRRSLQNAAACKMKLTQAGSNPLNPSMVSSAYGIQQLKRSPNDFIVHQSIEHDPDCALVEHLKWISNSQLLDPSSFYAKAPTPDYNTLNSKYSTFVKYSSNANSPEAIYGDQVMSNQLSALNNGVASSHSASSTEAGGGSGCGSGHGSGNAPVLNVRTNLNDSTSSRSNSNNTENHFCPPEVNFMPVPKIAPASSESKLSVANAHCRVNACSCDGNQVLLQPANNTLYGCNVHGTLPKKRPHTAMNQPFYGTVFSGGAPQMACEMHTFLPQNRLQLDAVEVFDRGSVGRAGHDMASFNNMDQLAVTKCDLPDWYRTHSNHHMSPSSPYAAHNRVQMHSPYGIYSEARVLPTGTIINTIQHQPMIPVKELEGDEV